MSFTDDYVIRKIIKENYTDKFYQAWLKDVHENKLNELFPTTIQSNIESCHGNINWRLPKIFDLEFIENTKDENNNPIEIHYNNIRSEYKNVLLKNKNEYLDEYLDNLEKNCKEYQEMIMLHKNKLDNARKTIEFCLHML